MLEVQKTLEVKKEVGNKKIEVKNIGSRSKVLLLEKVTPRSHRITMGLFIWR